MLSRTFRGGGIADLIDPADSYPGWSFYNLGRGSQVRQVEG